MTLDLYTKVCLTVIALSLGMIALKDISPINPAWASSGAVHKIAICTDDGAHCVGVTKGRNGHLMVNN